MGQQVINGLFLGSIYALFALGYTLVFGVLDILNLAHAAVFMLATFVAVALVGHGIHILLALPAAVLFAGLLGLVLERVRPANALVLEANHDVKMLQDCPSRPWPLKQRILGKCADKGEHHQQEQNAHLRV